ncbi:hypothetical protein AVV36_gp094 [Pectobacterium bacteriophage PM2]|uniref:Uncharacterized protein n=1 Tax=Pectobacterium bacteriophage PM2 TaxID=1429794 RepID=A0A0A0Q0D8_9CAUD|nr:hypothetical protein AVV36_gp094 [Pectobacterium bacteriophage PM2]AHY25056.1 hypothetical protein PM2_094 [Pectobacterium bacteriophage PM2]
MTFLICFTALFLYLVIGVITAIVFKKYLSRVIYSEDDMVICTFLWFAFWAHALFILISIPFYWLFSKIS